MFQKLIYLYHWIMWQWMNVAEMTHGNLQHTIRNKQAQTADRKKQTMKAVFLLIPLAVQNT
jgi:hypothetical protein